MLVTGRSYSKERTETIMKDNKDLKLMLAIFGLYGAVAFVYDAVTWIAWTFF